MKKMERSPVQKYLFLSIALSVCMVIVIIFSTFLINSVWLQILLVIGLLFCHTLVVKRIAKKYIFSILYEELNPHEFNRIISKNKYFQPNQLHIMYAAYLGGNYQATVDFCMKKIQTSPKYKFFSLTFLAQVYFCLQDIKKLSEICTAFDQQRFQTKDSEKVKEQYPLMQFFTLYCQGDYSTCKALLQNSNQSSQKWINVQLDYYRAVVNYKIGEEKTAQEQFDRIITTAPHTHFSTLSKEYLQRIEGLPVAESPEVLPNPGSILATEKKHPLTLIKNIAIILLILLLLISRIGDLLQNVGFEDRVHEALSMEYKEYEVLEIFDIENDEKLINTVCVVATPNGIDFGFITQTGLRKVSYTDKIRDITKGRRYLIKSPTSDWVIGFYLFESKDDIPEKYYKLIKIGGGEESNWLCFDMLVPYTTKD